MVGALKMDSEPPQEVVFTSPCDWLVVSVELGEYGDKYFAQVSDLNRY